VAWPDGAGDVSLGIVGVSPSHDIDTAYAIGSTVPVYYCGSGATVWVRIIASQTFVAGTPVMNDGATAVGTALTAADSNVLISEQIGRVTHWADSIASESWAKVRLS